LSAYRNFKVFLNVNSVTDSPTMFARRVFEILASSTAVVSTASSGIERMLGEVVALVHDEEEARAEFARLLCDPAYRQRQAHLGYRKVTREHTYAARFRSVVRTIGLDLAELREEPEVTIVIPLCEARWLEHALANLRRQRYARIAPLWVLRDGLQANELAERIAREWPGAQTVRVGADAPLVTMARCGLEAAQGALVTSFEPRDLYGPEFIGDLALALTYADAAIVGKGAYFTALPFGQPPALKEPSAQYRYVDRVPATAWLGRRELITRAGIERVLGIEQGSLSIRSANGLGGIYSPDPYNYLRFAEADCGMPVAVAAGLGKTGGCDVNVMI
jgi:hypothetical protein